MNSKQSLHGKQDDLPHLKRRAAVGWKVPLIVGVVLAAIVVTVAVPLILWTMKSPSESQLPHVHTPAQLNTERPAPCCPDGWVGYRGKCYYFSDAEGTWDSSQKLCSSLNASLAGIDTLKDLNFIMRFKGISEYWIGLKRVSTQPWKWVTGKQFNDLFMVRGEGECAYLSDGFATSSWCSTKRYWLCSKPEGMRREDAIPGD